ncbi:MAG: MarC family protein, partial [Burkholderiaceae bacterium]
FQVGGGLLMLTSALSMINARAAEAAAHDEDVDSIDGSAVAPVDHSQHSVAVVPLTIPLLTGPATMSTVVIYADQAQTFWQHAALLGYGVVIAVLTFACFSTAPAISRVLGKTGINVMTRLMGLILAALSVEVIAKGLQQLFPVLAG